MTYLPSTSADFATDASAASKQSVTGATVPAPASRVIEFEFRGRVGDAAAATNGIGFGVTIPSGATVLATCEIVAAAAGTDAVHVILITASDTFALPTAMAGTTDNLWIVSGTVVTGATAGEIQLRVSKEEADAITVRKGVTRRYVDCCAA
jgi:hypothetical protein